MVQKQDVMVKSMTTMSQKQDQTNTELGEIRRTLSLMTEVIKVVPDHEQPIRRLEDRLPK